MPQDAMRVLVLGTGPFADQARQSLTRQGIAIAQRLTKTVTHLIADDTVPDADPRLERARQEGVKALPPHFLAPAPARLSRMGPVAHVDTTLRYGRAPITPQAAVSSAPRDGVLTMPGTAGGVGFIGSPVWALLPLLTLGIAAPVVIGQAAYRLKSVVLGLSAAGYGLAVIVFVGIVSAYESPDAAPPAADFISALAFFTVWLGATVQAFLVRHPARSANNQAVARPGYRRELRYAARMLVARDMAAARDLGIGRPDLPSDYDDGGLIDVNHAPLDLLTSLAGITPTVAQQIITRRGLNGGFGSSAELLLDTDLDPAALSELDEYAVFIH